MEARRRTDLSFVTLAWMLTDCFRSISGIKLKSTMHDTGRGGQAGIQIGDSEQKNVDRHKAKCMAQAFLSIVGLYDLHGSDFAATRSMGLSSSTTDNAEGFMCNKGREKLSDDVSGGHGKSSCRGGL